MGDGVINKTHRFYKDNTMPLEPTNMVERLRKFVAAVNGKRPPYHGLFLELFSGIGSVSTAIRNRNHAAIPVDFETQLCIDLTLPGVVQLIISWIKTGMVRGVFLGTPCTSWSRARFGAAGCPGGPVRTTALPMGISGLRPKDQRVLDLGNATYKASNKYITACIEANIPCILENPATSIMWQAPALRRLMGHKECDMATFDMCSFGTSWRKRTRLVSWNAPLRNSLRGLCQGRGTCSFSGDKHERLRGNSHGVARTKLAQAYPSGLSKEIAACLVAAEDALALFRLHRDLAAKAPPRTWFAEKAAHPPVDPHPTGARRSWRAHFSRKKTSSPLSDKDFVEPPLSPAAAEAKYRLHRDAKTPLTKKELAWEWRDTMLLPD